MMTAKLFENGRSQGGRMTKEMIDSLTKSPPFLLKWNFQNDLFSERSCGIIKDINCFNQADKMELMVATDSACYDILAFFNLMKRVVVHQVV